MTAANVGVGAVLRHHQQQPQQQSSSRQSRKNWQSVTAGKYAFCRDLDHLDDGVTSSVYRCRDDNGEFYAIKIFKNRPPPRELSLLRQLRHENIVRLVDKTDVQLDDKIHTGLVLEFCDGGSLHGYLKRPENLVGLGDSDFLTLLYNMSDGLAYLREGHKVLHRDIKPGNILICWDSKRQPVFKLADFGSSRELEDDGEFQSLVGTYEFLHPNIYSEVYSRLHLRQSHCAAGGYKPECDLWSLGVTLFQAAAGQLPFAPFVGVRNDHMKMIDIILKKPADAISGLQAEPNGPIVYSNTLPQECRLCGSVQQMLVGILRGVLVTDFERQWSFTKFFEAVTRHKRKLATYYFVAAKMARPDLVFSDKPTYESLLSSLSECTGFNKDELMVHYRSQEVTAFPTGTTDACPVIVLSKQKFACMLDAKELNFDYVKKRPRRASPDNPKEVKDYIEGVYRMAHVCKNVARTAHLHHSLMLEAKDATLCLFRQRSQEAHQKAGSKIAMISSSQQKVGRLLELAQLVRAQVTDDEFANSVGEWRRLEEAEQLRLQEMQRELQDPNSCDSMSQDRLTDAFAEFFGGLEQPAVSGQCMSEVFHKVELLHERYLKVFKQFNRNPRDMSSLLSETFRSDVVQLERCVDEFQRIVRTCCVETLMSVAGKYDQWLRRVEEEFRRLAGLEKSLQVEIEAALDMLHDRICRGSLNALRTYFSHRNANKESDFASLSQAISGLIESTGLVQQELTKNSELLKELDELGLRNAELDGN